MHFFFHNVKKNYFNIYLKNLISSRTSRQRRPDRAVYIPRHRRSLETEGSPQPLESVRVNRTIKDNSSLFSASHGKSNLNIKEANSDIQENKECIEKENTFNDDQSNTEFDLNMCFQTETKGITSSKIPIVKNNNKELIKQLENLNKNVPNDSNNCNAFEVLETSYEIADTVHLQTIEGQEISSNFSENKNSLDSVETCIYSEVNVNEEIDRSDKCKDNIIMTNSTPNNKKNMEFSNKDEITNQKNTQMMHHNMVSNVLIISDTVQKESQAVKEVIPIVLPEKKVKKIVRQKSKPAPPPSPPIKKINRDECDWDSLFDDNGDCLDPTLIEEVNIYKYYHFLI